MSTHAEPVRAITQENGRQLGFSTPARIDDFPHDLQNAARLAAAWTLNVAAWTEQAILGNPWNAVNGSDQTFYFNPLAIPTAPPSSSAKQVPWGAFPNRILYYFGNLSQAQQWELADTGAVQGVTLPEIPSSAAVCSSETSPTIPFGPYGPRGWLDEYCEWAVTRDSQGNITRIDFTCENPEYWYTLWSVSPERVCEIYQSTLGKPQIQLEDLYLRDPSGNPVTDPSTGRPCYNPLNQWNSGTASSDGAGGAMHLTSTPNNLGTEIALAGAATVQRTMGNSDAEALLCCGGPYGQPHRNSDPTIGQAANQVVAGQATAGVPQRITLADPVGLYIQTPSWDAFGLPDDPNLPADAQPSECWTVVRGVETLDGFDPADNFILHATFTIPERWRQAGVTATVSQMSVNGNGIDWASQIAQTFQMALYPVPIPAGATPPKFPCVGAAENPLAQPLQLFHQPVFDAYYPVQEPNPRMAISLASNTVLTPPTVFRGKTFPMAITCDTVDAGAGYPTVEFLLPLTGEVDAELTATVTGLQQVTYAIPGNSYPGTYHSVRFTLEVGAAVLPGVRSVRVTNAGQQPADAAPGFLHVGL